MADPLLVRCSSCGATNRIPREKIAAGREPVCGRCKNVLRMGAFPVVVTDANFSDEVEKWSTPVLLDLWAPWCAPCRMIAPILDQLASEMDGQVRVAKLNVDENPVTARRFAVQSIPSLLVLIEGKEIDRIVGVQPKAEIARRLNLALQQSR